MTRILLIMSACALYFSTSAYAAQTHTVYLVRHAEKEANQSNPSLTRCGQVRAHQLAKILEEAKIEKVYSTSTLRSMATANPIASQQKLVIDNYLPDNLMILALKLREGEQNVLVVGHSNTTPQLIEMLTGAVIPEMSDSDYQELYQIQYIDGYTYLTTLKQPLTCQ